MKKKVLMLAGALSCAMMVFSVQADMGDTEMDSSMPGHGCKGRDLRLECPEAVKNKQPLDECCRDYCSKHSKECHFVEE